MSISTIPINDTPFTIAGKEFASRFLMGTGKFKNKRDLEDSILSSGTEIVTVALRRIDLDRHEENILEYIPKNITLLTNTSGARTAEEAIRIARLQPGDEGDGVDLRGAEDAAAGEGDQQGGQCRGQSVHGGKSWAFGEPSC